MQSLVVTSPSAYDAAKGAHAIAILTEWDEFKNLDYGKIYDLMAKPVRDHQHAHGTPDTPMENELRSPGGHALWAPHGLLLLTCSLTLFFLLTSCAPLVPVQAFIFDGRNILEHERLRSIGFEVYAIGKPRTKDW